MIWSRGHQLQSGKYRIIRELGRGGFGVTYLAVDCLLDRQVVIKTPNRQFEANQEYKKFILRFQREGKVLDKISHPNVVQVIEFFQEVDIPCLVMAYVDGEALNKRIHNQGQLSENEAVEIFCKLATALQTVHQESLIHCDIKPDNIMLRRQSGEPVLIDFGSAKSLQPATITVTTTINENYAPYEQYQKNRKHQPTLDVYALAATLYFAVTGEKPQAARNRILDVAQKKTDPLTSPQQYQPGLSDCLNQAILQGMAIEPQDRPQSMQAWLDLLHPPQSGQQPIKLLQLQIQIKLALRKSFSKIRETSSVLVQVFLSILETLSIQGHQIFSKSIAGLHWILHQLSTSPLTILLGFILLGYLLMGTLLGLTDNVTGIVSVAWAGAFVWAFILARDGRMAGVKDLRRNRISTVELISRRRTQTIGMVLSRKSLVAGAVAFAGIGCTVTGSAGAKAFIWGWIGAGIGAGIGAWVGTAVFSEALVGTVVVPVAAPIVWGILRAEVVLSVTRAEAWTETIRVMPWFVLVVVAGIVVGIVLWFRTFEVLEERYDFNFGVSFTIFGVTSTLGLILGRILGWWLKLQGVSLPF